MVGNAFALAAAFAYTVYIFVTEWATKDVSADIWSIFAVELLTMSVLGAGITASTIGLHGLTDQTTAVYLLAAYVGLITTVVPTGISIFFQRYMNPVTTAFLYTTEPLWGAFLAALLLHEMFSTHTYVGGVFIVMGTLLHVIGQSRRTPPAALG